MLTIHERVLNELYFDVAIPRDRLKVKFQNDWVILSGEVDWPYQRSCAEADARRVPGVTGVTNEISVHRNALPSQA
jgi:osmotically-inducible protein OsmY